MDSTRGNISTVTHKRPEFKDMEREYALISDCVAGQRTIKKGGSKYLPMPNATDTSEAALQRYDAYKQRAVFYNVTQRTLSGLVGEVFNKDPVAELPTGLDPLAEDANGAGLTLTQLAKRATRHTLAKGRAGLFVDYPQTAGVVSKAEKDAGHIQPTITAYDATDVINWRTERVGAKTYLTLVVLRELYDKQDDGFVIDRKEQWRVLRLTDGLYTQQLYREGLAISSPVQPTDASGTPFDFIPFTFVGAENNDAEIDHPPMLDLAQINVAHYRNSADYEEAIFMVGQPTPVFSGLTEDWVKNVMQGTVNLGSRGGVMLPENGKAELLKMDANGAAFEAMQHKEKQMVALGAKLVENKEVQRTAQEAGQAKSSEMSVLSSVAKNVSAAITFALQIAARFNGDADTDITYELNTDYELARMTAQDRAQVVSEWQNGAITWGEMRATLRKTGVATEDDDEARELIDEAALEDEPTANPNDATNEGADEADDEPDDTGAD